MAKRRTARTLDELVDLVQEATSFDRNVVKQILGEVEKAGGHIEPGREVKDEPLPDTAAPAEQAG